MSAEMHKKLKIALIKDENSLANFFNEAAQAYLANNSNYKNSISDILGGSKNDKKGKIC
jgi:hypothetical protein